MALQACGSCQVLQAEAGVPGEGGQDERGASASRCVGGARLLVECVTCAATFTRRCARPLLAAVLVQEVDKMKRGFEEQMTKMRGEVSKIQEEKVHLMGLEQRLRQEFQTQVT